MKSLWNAGRPRPFWIWLLRAGVVACLAFPPAGISTLRPAEKPQASAQSDAEDAWNVIYVGQDRIGYARSRAYTVHAGRQAIRRSETEQHYKLKRFGQSMDIDETLVTDEIEDDGSLLGFTLKMNNFASGAIRMEGKVDGKKLRLNTTMAGRSRESQQPMASNLKSPVFAERFLGDPCIKPGEKRSFQTFLPEVNQFTTISAVGEESRSVTMHDGSRRDLLRVRISYSAIPEMHLRTYVDENGTQVKSEMDILGTTIVLYRVPKEVALEAIAGGELDLAVSTLVRVKPILQGHHSKRVVYRITVRDGDVKQDFPSGPTQTVKQFGPHSVELTVTAAAPPRDKRAAESSAEFLQDSPFLESTDRRVIEHARRAVAGATSAWDAALKMERYVHDKLSNKNFSTAMATAAEVAKNLEGDCTEHAVLLAAMLRTQKIPSRVAVGLVYAEDLSSFAGHMWTEAFFDGRWIPLDATLGLGGIGAAHIKLGDSSLAEDAPAPVTAFLPLLNLIGKMQIEVVESE